MTTFETLTCYFTVWSSLSHIDTLLPWCVC